MSKRTVEIEDNLDEIIESARDDVKQLIKDYIEENHEKPDYSDLDYSGSMHPDKILYQSDTLPKREWAVKQINEMLAIHTDIINMW